ncbi:hypothetical protein RM780_20140 [Streptomyces sp. DSM 44917]|uniref:Uncharacterized protein n=1 Tax=Streptomyces boetiae TaxID=3075541 RepID=A0ABU2LCF9_9ACTN|nr:hypothetical protein [Streptomyces sp. DSM 44917]MDT0309254.1 hypothetical protein [Streptomyces sp. DSM 44917]
MTEVDHVLREQVRQVNALVVRLGERVNVVSGQVSAVDARQAQTQDDLKQLRDDFLTFVNEARRTAHVQRAETRVGVIRDELDHEFGHNKVVRRTAVGMLQAFDVGLVSEQTVRSVSEELMLQTPRYWLAPVLVALAAWSSDERALCERAVEEGFRRSPGRTSLFFALVLRRQGRREEATRWLRHFLNAQDPYRLGREFAVILECVSQGAFGGPGRELLRERMADWREKLLADEAAAVAQVERWRAEIESLRGPTAAAGFPRLAALSPQWQQLDAVLGAAAAQRRLLDTYRAVVEREFTPTGKLEDAVDDILDRLVSEYDTEELPLRRDLAFNQAVIDCDGDLDAAAQRADAHAAALEETLDYLTVQTASALDPESIGVSPATQRLAVVACHPWLSQAHEEFSLAYRAALPPDVQVTLSATHNTGARNFSLPPWTGSFTQPLEALQNSLAQHWDQHGRWFVDSLAYPWKARVIALAATALAVLGVVGSFDTAVGLGAAAVVSAVWGFVIHRQVAKAAAMQDHVRQLLARSREESLRQLSEARAELTDWQSRFQAADAVSAEVRAFLDDLPTAGNARTPFEQRTVPPAGAAGPAGA